MTIRLVKKFQQETKPPAVEVTKPVSCAKTIQTWVDEFKQAKRSGSLLAGWPEFGASQIQPASDCVSDGSSHRTELDHLKKAS